MPVTSTVGYALSITRSPIDPVWIRVRLRKHHWNVERKSRSRVVAETTFHCGTMDERTLIESALREILRAYVDELQ